MNIKTKQVFNYLMFASLSEVMLMNYQNTRMLNIYDSSLENKLKNLKANFERTSNIVFTSFTEDEQKQFYNMINIFERLIQDSGDHQKFVSLLSIVEEFQSGKLTVIEGSEV